MKGFIFVLYLGLVSVSFGEELQVDITKPIQCSENEKAAKHDKVTVHYGGFLKNGTKFDSSFDRLKPFTFELGVGQVIPGWDQGLIDVCAGEERHLVVPANLAYGDRGAGDVIPPGATLLFDIVVVDVEKAKSEADLEAERLAAEAEEERLRQEELQRLREEEAARAEAEEKRRQEEELQRKQEAEDELKRQQQAQPQQVEYEYEYIDESEGCEPGTLQTQIVRSSQGRCPRKAQAGDKLSMHYTGRLLNGRKFDSSKDRNKPFDFTLGVGQVIQGWDDGVIGMCVGETRNLIIPPALAYGAEGVGNVIPPCATLEFEVELLSIV